MNIFEAKKHFSKIKTRLFFSESAFALQEVEKFTPTTKLHHEVQIVFALESILKFDYKRISSQLLHDFKLSKNLFISSLLLHNKFLAHRLDRNQTTRILFSGKVYFLSESTFTYNFQFVKIIHRDLF